MAAAAAADAPSQAAAAAPAASVGSQLEETETSKYPQRALSQNHHPSCAAQGTLHDQTVADGGRARSASQSAGCSVGTGVVA